MPQHLQIELRILQVWKSGLLHSGREWLSFSSAAVARLQMWHACQCQILHTYILAHAGPDILHMDPVGHKIEAPTNCTRSDRRNKALSQAYGLAMT